VAKKRATESMSQDGLGMLRQGLKQWAPRLPDLDVDYVGAALAILRTALEVKNYYAEGLLRQVDLTPARLSLLMALYLCGDQALTSSALGELLVVSPGNITGLVDGLAADRLVRRVADPSDRRAVVVELTARGRRFVRWLAPLHFRVIRSLMSGLSKAQARSLAGLLDEVRKQIRSTPQPSITRRPF
jgi:DNA-binding MarR family transcriptional regulator